MTHLIIWRIVHLYGVSLLLLVVLVTAATSRDGVEERHKWMLQQNITTIHLVSSCHLDVGFADSATNIVNRYFDVFFPEAILRADLLRRLGGDERLVFTTHSYLVSLYLDCPPNMGLHCPSEHARKNFTDAIMRGDITWHAFPFNAQPEYLLQYLMIEIAVGLTHTLDDMFAKQITTTMSQRDVPGMTSAMIPVLRDNGVQAITVGVNEASMPPDVPTVFRWHDKTSNATILAMWHPGGYGGTKGISLDSMVVVPGMSHALAFAIRGDNSGPPSVFEVIKNYATLKELFPAATIVASDYDSFVRVLLEHQDDLPVISGEIGDTWIHGVASDPLKTQKFYTIINTWYELIPSSPGLYLHDDRIHNFSRLLIKNGEHTWGKDVKKYLNDWTNWDNKAFKSHLSTPPFQDMVNSWVEQRLWGIDYALEALGDHPLLPAIQVQLDLLHFDGVVSTTGYQREDIISARFVLPVKGGTISIQFDDTTGGIVHFSDSRISTESMASSSHPLAQVMYQTFTNKSYDAFLNQYLYTRTSWAYRDFGKYGMNMSTLQVASPTIKKLWSKLHKEKMEYTFLLQLAFTSDELVSEYGAPEMMWLEVGISNDTLLNMVLYIVNKTATRLPESLSVFFDPPLQDNTKMFVTKLDSLVPVDSVLHNGSQHLHASQTVTYTKPPMTLLSLDTSLLCVGYPTPFPTPPSKPAINDGFSFNIFNNIWGTNYVMWYPYLEEDKNSKYRFVFDYSKSPRDTS